jgi:hypothetical protein
MTPPPHPTVGTGPDRRIAQRFQPAFGTIYRFANGSSPEDAGVGLVWNISQTGVSMLLADPPQRGEVVRGELATDAGNPLAMELKVVHVRPVSTGDYLLGAQFARPLNYEELERFLTPPPRPAAKA